MAANGCSWEELYHLAIVTGMHEMERLKSCSGLLRLLAEQTAAGETWAETGLIFTNFLGGPIDARNLLPKFKQLLNGAGRLPIRFYQLRHTAVSLMLIMDIVFSRKLGHARPSITLDVYGHLIPGIQADAARKIDELITPVKIESSNQLHPICTRKKQTEILSPIYKPV